MEGGLGGYYEMGCWFELNEPYKSCTEWRSVEIRARWGRNMSKEELVQTDEELGCVLLKMKNQRRKEGFAFSDLRYNHICRR